jgi:HK97 family phage prohead protease
MTMLENETQPEARESGLLRRTFVSELVSGDGRTIDVRIVPYGERATVDDGFGPYSEEFAPGAFDKQLAAGHRLKVWLNFQHRGGIADVVGKGIALREEPDALYGSFRAYEDAAGDKALLMVNEGDLDSVSLEFASKKAIRTSAGVVRRVKAHLSAVALCREGAYSGAKVLAVREQAIIDEELLPIELDPELVERCRRLGIELPQRYQAHPAETDTSAEADTSEDGTRRDQPIPTPEGR